MIREREIESAKRRWLRNLPEYSVVTRLFVVCLICQFMRVAFFLRNMTRPSIGGMLLSGAKKDEVRVSKIENVEKRIFNSNGVEYTSKMVPVRFHNSEIYTICVQGKNISSPDDNVVLIHGFGAGVATWAKIIPDLASTHNVYGFDLLGFGRSSRPSFSSDAAVAELEMVEAIEDWRKEMGLKNMILIAHSFGAYLASSYALEHPTNIKHLVLVDPWGFPEKVETTDKQIKPYSWMSLAGSIAGYFNPLAALRAMGSYAPYITAKLRPDLQARYPSSRPNDIYKYIYQCNQHKPTGETAFTNMSIPVGWAKRPMVKRFHGIDEDVPVTFIYGGKSWIDPAPAILLRGEGKRYLDIQVVTGAGHHVFADDSEAFNALVRNILDGKLAEETSTESSDTCCA